MKITVEEKLQSLLYEISDRIKSLDKMIDDSSSLGHFDWAFKQGVKKDLLIEIQEEIKQILK